MGKIMDGKIMDGKIIFRVIWSFKEEAGFRCFSLAASFYLLCAFNKKLQLHIGRSYHRR